MTRRTSPGLLFNLAAAALLVGSVAGHAQADTIWRFPPKGGAPYAVPHDHSDRVALGQRTGKQKAVHSGRAKRTHVAGAKSTVAR